MEERRSAARYALSLPITVYLPGLNSVSRHAGSTLDISTSGLCFLLEFAPSPGSELDFTVTLSRDLAASADAFIHGSARVCRVVDCGDNRFRIAAFIESYEISRQNAVKSARFQAG